jgi:YVTN family beta-propeller protein
VNRRTNTIYADGFSGPMSVINGSTNQVVATIPVPDSAFAIAVNPRTGTVALVDRGWLETGRVTAPGTTSVFAGFRFPPEVISVAVRW